MIKKINYLIQSFIIYFFFLVGRLVGIEFSRKIFSNLFLFIGPYFKSSKILNKNIENFSHNISHEEKTKITESMWKNYGMTFIEYIFLNYFHKNNTKIVIEGEDILSPIITKKKQVIFISGHFANFELMSMEICRKKIPLATIYRPLNNPFLNPFMEYLRKKYVCKNQIKKGINGVREAIDYINNKYNIALMIDQRVGEGEKVDFFNKPALTTTLPAQLAIKYDLEIIPVFIERTKNNSFKIEFQKEILPKKFNSKIDLTKELNKTLEKMIKRNPYQWIWTHDRWR